MQKVKKLLTTTGTWAAGATLGGIDLPREGLITEIRLRARITATLTATAVQDCTRRAIETLQVRGDGGKTYLGLTGGDTLGRLMALLNLCDFGIPALHAEADVGTTVFDQSFVIHPGSNPRDPFDTSAIIPARSLATLQAIIGCPAAAVTDAAGNITAGTYSLEVNEILDEPVRGGMMVPTGYIQSWANDANYASYGKKFDIPAGQWLRRIVIMSQDDTATTPLRVDDEIAGLKLEFPKTSTSVIEANWEDLKFATAKRYRITHAAQEKALGATATTRPGYNGAAILPAGFVVIDLRDYFDPIYGMNLTAYQTGDVKLGATITNWAAGDDTIIFWDTLALVDRVYVGK